MSDRTVFEWSGAGVQVQVSDHPKAWDNGADLLILISAYQSMGVGLPIFQVTPRLAAEIGVLTQPVYGPPAPVDCTCTGRQLFEQGCRCGFLKLQRA